MTLVPTPFTTPIVNPRNLSLLNRAPYLSVSGFAAAATSVDTSQLVPAGSAVTQEQALAEIIDEVSSWMDGYCFPDGTGGTLAASYDTDTGWARVGRDGFMSLICRFKPILELNALALGILPSQQINIPVSNLADVNFGRKIIRVPAYALATASSAPAGQFPYPTSTALGTRLYATWTYLDGYPHTALAVSCIANASTIQVNTVNGVYQGTQLRIYDGVTEGANNEWVTVQSAVTAAGITTLTLVSPTRYAHTVPAAPDAIIVSGLPPRVYRAAILLTTAMVKNRGSTAMVLKDLSDPELSTKPGEAMESDIAIAAELLDDFRVVTPSR